MNKNTSLKRGNCGDREVPKKTICRNEEESIRHSAKNSRGSTNGIVNNCRVKNEAVEDLRHGVQNLKNVKDEDDVIFEQTAEDHGVAFVVIKREQVENTPPSPVESLGKIDVNTHLSKNYKEELKCSSAENQKLKVQVSKLTTELESYRLKVAALETDKANINYELVSLQVASEGQTREIKDLEQRNATLKSDLELGLHKVTAGLSEVKEAFAQYHASQKVFGAGNDQNLALSETESVDLVEQRVEVDVIAESEVLTIADAASVAVVPQQSDELGSATFPQQPSSLGMVKEKHPQTSFAFRCKISPMVKCTMHKFLEKVEYYKNNIDSQLRFRRNQAQEGLVVFNNCKEGILIKAYIWKIFLKSQNTLSLMKQFRGLMVAMLDDDALFYLTLEGQMRGCNKIQLAAVHPGLKAAVYAALKVDAKTDYKKLHHEFERHLAELRLKVCIEDLPSSLH